MIKKFICLQSGHQNTPLNCDPTMRKGTGAPGEVQFTISVRDAVSRKLLEKKNTDGSDAFTVQLVDATFNCDKNVNKNDYALFLSIHYDADVYGKGGGFVDFPEPNTDYATNESQRIAKAITEEYFPNSGIEYVNRSNANTRFYYMWKFLSANTPCNIIECGVGQNAHDKVILADTERVSNAIVRGICKAFNVPYDVPVPQPPTPPINYQDLYNKEVEKNKELDRKINESNNKISLLQTKIDNAKTALS